MDVTNVMSSHPRPQRTAPRSRQPLNSCANPRAFGSATTPARHTQPECTRRKAPQGSAVAGRDWCNMARFGRREAPIRIVALLYLAFGGEEGLQAASDQGVPA